MLDSSFEWLLESKWNFWIILPKFNVKSITKYHGNCFLEFNVRILCLSVFDTSWISLMQVTAPVHKWQDIWVEKKLFLKRQTIPKFGQAMFRVNFKLWITYINNKGYCIVWNFFTLKFAKPLFFGHGKMDVARYHL